MAQQPILAGKELEVEVGFPNNVLNIQKPKWQPGIFSQTSGKYPLIEDILIVLAISFPFLLATCFFINKPTFGSKSGSRRRGSSNYYDSNYGGYYGGGSSGGDGGGGGGGG